MTTVFDFLTSVKDEAVARYKSPFWGVALITLIAFHWKILVFFFLDSPRSVDAIAYVEANVSFYSVVSAFAVASVYVIFFPWFELYLSKLASSGIRSRNDFQIREREREIGRRKLIATQEAQTIEIEFKNKEDQSKIADIELVRQYQNTLSGENFTRWLKDAQNGVLNNNLNHSISSYLNKADSIEGKFINQDIEKLHQKFVQALSTFSSVTNDNRSVETTAKKKDLMNFATNALNAQQEYRKEVRDRLGV